MSEDLKLAFSIDSADAVKGVADVEKALGGVKTAAATANSAVGELSGALKDKLGPSAEAAYVAFQKLSTAEGPRALQRRIIDAENAMKAFKAAADAAKASGEKMPAGVAAGLKAMQADIDASTKKLGQVRDQMGDVKTRADAMGQGFAQAASSGGSLNSMLSNLEARGGLAGSFSKIALAAGGAFAAFQVGIGLGRELSAGLKTLGINIDVSAKSWSNFAVTVAKIAGDTKAGAWFRDLADSTRKYDSLLTPLPGKMNEVMKAQQSLNKGIQEADALLKALGLEFSKSGAGLDKFVDKMDLVDRRFHDALQSGESMTTFLRENDKAVGQFVASLEKQGIALEMLPKDLQNLVKAYRETHLEVYSLTQANEEYEKSLIAQAAAAHEAANAQFDADLATVHKRNADAMKEEAAAAVALGDAFGRLAGGLTAVRAEAEGAMAGLEGVNWSMRKATPATIELTDAQKALIESLAKISDAGGASSLWVGHLIAQLEAGEISLDQFTQKVNQLLQELVKLGPISGNTADELNKINTLLSEFKNNAGQGWPT